MRDILVFKIFGIEIIRISIKKRKGRKKPISTGETEVY